MDTLITLVKVLGVLYLVALLNRIVYLRKIFRMDLRNLEQQGKSEVAAIRTKMIREETVRYASDIANGIIGETERLANERIERLKIKHKHDLISSIITAITQYFGK